MTQSPESANREPAGPDPASGSATRPAELPPGFDKLAIKVSQVALIAVVWLISALAAEALIAKLIGGQKDNALLYYGLRLAVYMVPYGLAAWGVHRFAWPERRRKYWITLALALAVNVSPIGMFMLALIIFMVLPIYVGPM